MLITRHHLLRLGFESADFRCFKRIRSNSRELPDLLLDWDSSTGLWLTNPFDPIHNSIRGLNHITTLAQLTRFYWLLTGETLVYTIPAKEQSKALKQWVHRKTPEKGRNNKNEVQKT